MASLGSFDFRANNSEFCATDALISYFSTLTISFGYVMSVTVKFFKSELKNPLTAIGVPGRA